MAAAQDRFDRALGARRGSDPAPDHRDLDLAGMKLVRVSELIEGVQIDLEGDVHADPERDDPLLAHAYAVVDSVQQETPDCVVVHCTAGSYGFPNHHRVRVPVDQFHGADLPW